MIFLVVILTLWVVAALYSISNAMGKRVDLPDGRKGWVSVKLSEYKGLGAYQAQVTRSLIGHTGWADTPEGAVEKAVSKYMQHSKSKDHGPIPIDAQAEVNKWGI